MVSTQAYVRMIFTVLKTCDTRAQKIAALEAALLVTRADEQVEAERAGWQAGGDVVPTLEAVIDDAIAHQDLNAVKRLWPRIAEQSLGTRIALATKVERGFACNAAFAGVKLEALRG